MGLVAGATDPHLDGRDPTFPRVSFSPGIFSRYRPPEESDMRVWIDHDLGSGIGMRQQTCPRYSMQSDGPPRRVRAAPW